MKGHVRLAGLVLCALVWSGSAAAAEPIKIGFSMALTGGVAGIGKQILSRCEIWRDDVNAKGGLLGRPVELVYYDDQSNPSNVPGIYTKLIDIDKVDLLIGPYATNMVAPAIPIIMQHNKMTIGILANAANSEFHYPRYFSMIATGPEPEPPSRPASSSWRWRRIRAPQDHRDRRRRCRIRPQRHRRRAQERQGLRASRSSIDQNYPPTTADFAPIMRAVQAANPDIVFVAAYPPDTVGIVRAADEIGLDTKMFGGALIGLGITRRADAARAADERHRQQRRLPAGADLMTFRGRRGSLEKYQAKAAGPGHRSAGLCLPALRLCRGPGAGGRR